MVRKYNRTHIRVWMSVHGKIPKDEDGRSYEIHHIDGNPLNNSIDNLLCLSIKQHYELHVSQKDYGGAFLIANRMKTPPSDIAEIASKAMKIRVLMGTHNFLDPNFNRSIDHNIGHVVAIDTRTNTTVRITKIEFDTNDFYVGVNTGRKQKSIHTNRGKNKGKTWSIKNKEVPNKQCKYCSFVGRGSHVSRFHNERCKNKK